jgi:hypothetical protein
MTPDLYARMAPHLTVLTDGDPDMSTRDPVVARALSDAAGADDDTSATPEIADPLLRITVTAVGTGGARSSMVVVASAEFQNTAPRVNILLREHGAPLANDAVAAVRPGSRLAMNQQTTAVRH